MELQRRVINQGNEAMSNITLGDKYPLQEWKQERLLYNVLVIVCGKHN